LYPLAMRLSDLTIQLATFLGKKNCANPYVMQDGGDQSCTRLKRVRLRRGSYFVY
jgi:hypothetical protein